METHTPSYELIKEGNIYWSGKKAGIREVVDWVLSWSDYDCGHFILDIDQDLWQEKLDEWGINGHL